MKKNLFPIISLVFANLVVLLIAVIQNSSMFDLVFIFWVENVIIGFYNIFKMMKCNNLPDPAKEDLMKRVQMKSGTPLTKNKLILIFIGHFFAACFVHLLFINQFFNSSPSNSTPDYYLIFFGIGAMILSHGISFFINYLGKKEYLNYTLMQLMGAPYGRIIFVHFFIMGSAWLISRYGSDSVPILIAFIVGKILADLWRHGVEHRARTPLDPTQKHKTSLYKNPFA